MARGGRRTLSKNERESLKRQTSENDGEPFATVKGMMIYANVMIDNTDTTLERCMDILQSCNARSNKPAMLVPCSFCGKKFGLKQCAGCSKVDSIRYCSRECQVEAWPHHKTVCASRQTRVSAK